MSNAIDQDIIDALTNKIINKSNSIAQLLNIGYIPNESINASLQYSVILLDCYKHASIFSQKQLMKLEQLYNKIMKL